MDYSKKLDLSKQTIEKNKKLSKEADFLVK